MPLLLHDEDEERWLQAPLAEAMELVAPYPAQLMRSDRVASRSVSDAI